MLIMKKDMGGAANVLALAQMVMDAKLKVRLRVLIPAVENAVAGDAFRPLDIFTSRKGLTVEIGNTDAEGRLVLADALALACEEKPDLLIDLGTLTGAARVALGPDLPPFYTMTRRWRWTSRACAAAENDPLWRMPLWPPYSPGSIPRSPISTMRRPAGLPARSPARCSCSALSRTPRRWLHVDIFGWTPSAKAGAARRRRMPGRARHLQALERTIWMIPPELRREGDLAAKYLEGKVAAARFVEGEEFEISEAIAPLRAGPPPGPNWRPRRCWANGSRSTTATARGLPGAS